MVTFGDMTASREGERVGGRYELIRRLARGGGGTVWAAHDQLLQRQVAVKHVRVTHDLGSDPGRVRARVRAEARAAARLKHPGVVAIFDVVDDREDVYLVLEHVPWPTLAARVDDEGSLAERDVARIGLGVLDALEAAHAQGIVHRDVKPSNVFASPDGEVKLSDFGIAAIEGEARLTVTGATMGSPSFLAPEQAQGERAAPPADLWSLGVTLAHAVEGVPPFERSTAMATVHAVVNAPPRPFVRADRLVAPLQALLVKDPSRRPDAAEVRAALAPIAGSAAPRPRASIPTVVVPVRSTPAPASEVGDDPGPPAQPPTTPADAEVTAVEPAAAEPAAGEVAHVVGPDTGVDGVAGPGAPGTSSVGSRTSGRSVGRWAPAAAAAAAVALGAVLVGGPALDGGDEVAAPDAASDDATAPTRPAPTDDPPDGDGDTDDPDDTDAPDPEDAGEDAVPIETPPADWSRVEGDTYSLAIPADWEVEPGQGALVDHRDPDTGAYLRVDWTDEPEADPVANWERFEQDFAAGRDGYERVALRPATFQGAPAAYWEYRYVAGGQQLRAINLNVRVDDGRAYALNLQSSEDDWDDTVAWFPALAGGFEDDR